MFFNFGSSMSQSVNNQYLPLFLRCERRIVILCLDQNKMSNCLVRESSLPLMC